MIRRPKEKSPRFRGLCCAGDLRSCRLLPRGLCAGLLGVDGGRTQPKLDDHISTFAEVVLHVHGPSTAVVGADPYQLLGVVGALAAVAGSAQDFGRSADDRVEAARASGVTAIGV